MDNITSSYIEEPITATCSALSGVSASQPSESDDGHSIDDCCSDDASSTDEDDSATIMSLIQSDPHVNGRYKPFSSKIEAMAYLIAHCPRPMKHYYWKHHPTEPSSYIIANLKLIPVTSITAVMPQANTWARHIYKYSENGTLLVKLTNEAPVMEMAVPLVHELQSLEEGILMFDTLFNTNVIVIAPVICFLCDNPRAAEICNHLHLGSSTHKFCRICMADVRSDHICVGVKRKKHDSLMQVQRIKAAKTHQAKSTIRTEYGLYKYSLRAKIPQLSQQQRAELSARISTFQTSGHIGKISTDVAKHYKSFVGRDFKALAQMALFVLSPYLSAAELEVWIAVSKVFKIAYCDPFDPEKMEYYKTVCQNFVTAIETHLPEWKTKLKVHLVLHLPDDMLIHAPSKDIANNFAVQESIRFTFSGSYYIPSESLDLIKLSIAEVGEVTLNSLDPSFTVLLPHGWDRDQQVTSGSAIVGSDGLLINI
eukprot:Em0009g1054a